MTKIIRKKRSYNTTMTDSTVKYGCLSKSLENFLIMNEKDREQKYGKGKAKYYQRIVLDVQESFRDAVLAYNRLPPEYSRKIDLSMGFYLIQKEIINQKSPKDKANFAISQARTSLRVLDTEISYPDYFTKVFSKDFEKVQEWLVVLDNIEPTLKEKVN